jgi:hypothetical protein
MDKKQSVEDIYDLVEQDPIMVLKAELANALRDLEHCKKVIKDNDLENELQQKIDLTTMEEMICLNGIFHLSQLFKHGTFTKDDATTFDVLYKNLRLARGVSEDKVKKAKPLNKAQLFSIVKEAAKRNG